MLSQARLFYRASCKGQDDYIKIQLERGLDPPKINLAVDFIRDYYKINDLARDMDLIVDELMEEGVVDGLLSIIG